VRHPALLEQRDGGADGGMRRDAIEGEQLMAADAEGDGQLGRLPARAQEARRQPVVEAGMGAGAECEFAGKAGIGAGQAGGQVIAIVQTVADAALQLQEGAEGGGAGVQVSVPAGS
jgi:hypothetical protein